MFCSITTHCGASASSWIVATRCDLSFLTLHYCFIIPHRFQVLTSPSLVLLLFDVVLRSSFFTTDVYLLR
jgi:hypothetical protein